MKNGIYTSDVCSYWPSRCGVDTLLRVATAAFLAVTFSVSAHSQTGFEYQPVTQWLVPGGAGQLSASTPDAGALLACTNWAQERVSSYSNLAVTYPYYQNGFTCTARDTSVTPYQNMTSGNMGWTAVCPSGFVINGREQWPYPTPNCKKNICVVTSTACYTSTNYLITSVPRNACANGCQMTQTLGTCVERYSSGVQLFFCNLTKATTGPTCNIASGAVTCSTTAPGEQNPCELPGANTSAACGGGTGCPAGTTVLANGACTPNDSNAPCPAQSYRVDGMGACIPFPGTGAGSGGTGTGTSGGAGAIGAGGSSGGAGASGGAGGTGSGTGGGGGGGGSGGGGGAGGAAGSGGAGGSGGVGGAGGASKEDVKCGTTGNLCQSKFQSYYDDFMQFFGVTPAVAAEGQSFQGQFADGKNALNTGPVVNIPNQIINRISYANACPSPKTANVFGHTLNFDMAWICQLATMLGPFIAGLFGLAALRVLLSGL